ncbi:60S ribosomal protein L18-B [Verticillium dahliae VDG1]|nr:60S ribosomal protein L18-B [Verticillium dahliae VDG1]
MDDDISSFAAITNADPEVARGFLEMSGGNLEAAIQLFFENPDIQRSFGEEEDAAMAKRLQEELYGSGSGAGASGGGAALDDVRSPIRATTETLVAPSFGGGMTDAEEADMAALLQQERQRAAARARGGARNPFNHDASIWDGDGPHRSAGYGGGTTSASDARAQRLADLFRPPYDLMSTAEWDDAREQGKEDKKWLLVNLQDNSIFQCQTLNRDVWKDAAVQRLNADNFPHVAIVDPRTGEQVKVWSGVPFPSADDFHAQLAEFLDRYSLDASRKNPVARDTAKRPKFRLPTGGRVIRRFRVDDAVRRIYEWLKAEPLEGKAGVAFELKQMPQGQDLLQRADETILEAGLKQGTVMVEFLEE